MGQKIAREKNKLLSFKIKYEVATYLLLQCPSTIWHCYNMGEAISKEKAQTSSQDNLYNIYTFLSSLPLLHSFIQ